MPEPVVIIGPAKGPAGPIGEPAEAADRVAADDTGYRPSPGPRTTRARSRCSCPRWPAWEAGSSCFWLAGL